MLLLTTLRRNGTVDLFIALDEPSVDRLKEHDPAEVYWRELPPDYSMRLPNTISIGFCTKEDQAEIERMSASGDPDWKKKAFEFLGRGFKFRPELGDHDFGATLLGKPTEGPKQ